jgi:predicted phosphodiesterase
VPAFAGQIRQPADDETVALLVSDRHDNVGMDKVARALADAAGATMLLAAGDDTSTGSTWEAFSLDSLDQVFADYDHRFAITGNHDQGEFVGEYLADLGFTRPDGELVEGPDGIRVLGADDPRSSGLGAWRDEEGLSFHEHEQAVADRACEYDEQGDRVSTLLTHDANTGREALRRGCVDLVVGGHLHEQVGPREVVGANGNTGYTYTNGTTGGAAYAIAIGSKLRRNAMVTMVTYRDGRPVGVQPITIRTNGSFAISPFVPLDPPPGPPEESTDGTGTTNDPDEDETP